MSSGQNAADSVKGLVGSIGNATEDLRKNINSFADSLVGSGHSNSVDAHKSDFSKDSQKAGDMLKEGVEDAGKKVDELRGK